MKKLFALILALTFGILLCGCSDTSLQFSGTISENDEFCISKGQMIFINEKIVCEKGGVMKIERGGAVELNGKFELSGDLYVDGSLRISKNAEIYGTGTIHVVSSFDDINCLGTVTAKIDAPEPITKNGITTVGGVVIVNKRYSVPENYSPGLSEDIRRAIVKMLEY